MNESELKETNKYKEIVNEVLYAVRNSDDPIGALLRTCKLLPFTGETISYIIQRADELTIEEQQQIIRKRQLEWLKKTDEADRLQFACGFIIPSGWDDVLIEYLKTNPDREPNLIRITWIESPDEWERYPITPNKGYPGNTFEYVVFSYKGIYTK